MKARLALLAIILTVVALPAWTSQYQPSQAPDWTVYEARDGIGPAGDLDSARRVLRFVQVSDAHVIDDDAPEPMRVGFLDPLGEPFTSAQRPQEEYTDEVLDAMVRSVNALHAQDPFDFVITTGDNIDNQLENELMRFIDNMEGTFTDTGPFSGLACTSDGQSAGVGDDSNDVTDQCTHLPAALREDNAALAPGLPWFTAFGNHDGLIQGNVPRQPGFQEGAAQYGRYFIDQDQYVDMHFEGHRRCAGSAPAGGLGDDFGHGFGFAGQRLCDDDVDNDGYYAFSSRGVRFIVLDTVNDDFVTGSEHLAGLFEPQSVVGHDVIGGYADGAIDPAQFAWLRAELDRSRDELVILFSHHTINSFVSETGAEQCPQQGCLSDLLAAAGYPTRDEVVENLTRHPNVVAWFGGHTHKHNIEAKVVAGAASPGFWNVETSSLIDLPQQARAIELWGGGDGRAFLRLDRIDHDFGTSRELALSDEQVDPDAYAGDAGDQDVLLWFDVPAGVALAPQPTLPMHLTYRLDAPQRTNGSHAVVGEEVEVRVTVRDSRFGTGVEGLDVAVDVERSDRHDPVGVVRVEAGPVSDLGEGRYGTSFVAAAPYVHFVRFTIEDPTGAYPGLSRVASIEVAGEADVGSSGKKSPAPIAALLGALALSAAARRR